MEPAGKILVLSNTFAQTQKACDFLAEGGYQVVLPPPLEVSEKSKWVKNEFQKVSAVIVGHDRIDKEIIDSAPLLRVIAKQGVGLDGIDTLAAKEHGIKVLTAAGGNSDSVADLAILLLLAVSRKLVIANNLVSNGGWGRIVGHEVWNKNLGIIGFGEIGQRVASRAKGFSMQVAYYDVVDHADAEKEIGAVRMDLPALMAWSDYVSIHIPLNQHTHKLIDAPLLSFMKPTAYLINTSRGGVIDEGALIEALQNERIAGAGLDVFEQEPPSDLTLAKLPNVVATPHMAAYTVEAIERVSMQVANAVLDALKTP
jgi:D-3-phosphoglycerate dehydrogenase